MTTSLPNIIQKIEEHILQLFNKKSSSQLIFHDYRRAVEISKTIHDIGIYSGHHEFSKEIEVAKIASWFLAVGKLFNYATSIEISKSAAVTFLQEHEYLNEDINAVINCMENSHTPEQIDAQFLHDASLAYWATSNNARLSPLMKLEEELILDKKYEVLEWEQKHLEELLKAKFYTPYGQMVFSPIMNQNIVVQKKKTDNIAVKLNGKKTVEEGRLWNKFQGLEPKIPQRGIQTFFRAVYQNHIQLSAIADNKANMMTGINTILVSVVISIITYTNITETITATAMPLAIFLLTALVSMIFSVVSASPRVTRTNKKGDDAIDARKNVAFFGNFSGMELEEFEQAMDAMMRDDELIYGNMTRDLYYLGKTLDKKYRLLRISYHVFLGGFVASILLFSYIIFMN
jgi:hypothetical protein